MSKAGGGQENRTTPTSSFQRFAWIAIALGLLACLGVMFSSIQVGRTVIHNLYADKSLTVLRTTADLMGRFDVSMKSAQARRTQDRDKGENRFGEYTEDILNAFQPDDQAGKPSWHTDMGREGYLFFFQEDCLVIGHPTLEGEAMTLLQRSPSGLSICSKFKHIAEQASIDGLLHHDWDGGNGKEDSGPSKVTWCIRDSATDWYLCASVYKSRLDEALYGFVMGTALPPAAIIMILTGTLLAFIKVLLRSRQKATEEEINNLQKEIETLREKNARLDERDRSKSSFLFSISHDLRNPLTSILGYATLIKREFSRLFMPLAGEDQKLHKRGARIVENLEIIECGGWRLNRLIHNMLELDGIESGRVEWRDEQIGLRELIEASIRTAQEEFGDKTDLQPHLDLPENLPELCLDKVRMEQAVAHLLSHMAEFHGPGRLSLVAVLEGDVLRVEVRHLSETVGEDQLEKCFEELGQNTGEDQSKSQGKRLGPTIARRIIEHHRGRIWVETQPGQGSSVIFTLPLSPALAHSHPTASP